jgi:hypothetical protein
MDEATARAMIEEHFEASNVSVAGGGPGDDIARASEMARPVGRAVRSLSVAELGVWTDRDGVLAT